MKRDVAIFRAAEALVALVLLVALYHWIGTGTPAALVRDATHWYSHKVDGLFAVSVIDTGVKLPHLDKASLPIAAAPPTDGAAPSASTT